jgi:hypothetical protein
MKPVVGNYYNRPLEPSTSYRVFVRGVGPANVRFSVRLCLNAGQTLLVAADVFLWQEAGRSCRNIVLEWTAWRMNRLSLTKINCFCKCSFFCMLFGPPENIRNSSEMIERWNVQTYASVQLLTYVTTAWWMLCPCLQIKGLYITCFLTSKNLVNIPVYRSVVWPILLKGQRAGSSE